MNVLQEIEIDAEAFTEVILDNEHTIVSLNEEDQKKLIK